MTPSERDDQRWFKQHPDRSYRLRAAIGEEVEGGPSRAVRFLNKTITTKPFCGTVLFNSELTAKLCFEEARNKGTIHD